MPQQLPQATIAVEPVLVRADVDAALAGIFDLNTKLATIGDDVLAIRRLPEDDEGEEEAEVDA